MLAAPDSIVNGGYERVHGAMFMNVTNDFYHALPGTSSSNIRDIGDDVDQYMRGPLPHEPSDAKLLGAAAHCYILQHEWFNAEFSVYPGKVRRGKQWDEFVDECSDGEIITTKMHERCIGMRDSLAASGYSWMWERDDLVKEASVWARERTTSVLCKVRPDIYDPVD